MIGNSPSASSDGRIFTPCTAPENVIPASPCSPVTEAERVRTKSAGAFSMSSHWMPRASIRIGSQVGHWKESPVAEPTERKTPNPVWVMRSPLPVKPKLRPSPPMLSEPMVTAAPTAPKYTISASVPAAPVSSWKSRAVSVT